MTSPKARSSAPGESAVPERFRSTSAPDIVWHGSSESVLRVPCGAAAPLVVNGGHYVGCSLDRGHEGKHEVKITWE